MTLQTSVTVGVSLGVGLLAIISAATLSAVDEFVTSLTVFTARVQREGLRSAYDDKDSIIYMPLVRRWICRLMAMT